MSITLIIGPMFSGKTTELIRLVDRKMIAEKKCLIIKNKIDTRFTTNHEIVTHNKYNYYKCPVTYATNLSETENDIFQTKYDVVAIDEGFLFSDIYHFCGKLASGGIEVIVASIDSSFKQEPFIEIAKLATCSETILKLSAVCMICKKHDASFTIRTDNSTQEIVIGTDNYKSICRKCLTKHI